MSSLVRRAVTGLAVFASAVSIGMAVPVPAYAAAAEVGDSCNQSYCSHWWGPSASEKTDYAGIDHDQVWSCNRNNDERTIAIQVDPSDGKSEYYTIWDNVADVEGQPPCGETVENRSVHGFRYVAVDARTGEITGTPTEWKAPPWGQGPP
jgi:hypothetical protein